MGAADNRVLWNLSERIGDDVFIEVFPYTSHQKQRRSFDVDCEFNVYFDDPNVMGYTS